MNTEQEYPHEMPMKNGAPNPKYLDFLQRDPPVHNQQYTCCSFISPESVVKAAEMFYFEEYLKHYGVEYFAEFMHSFVMFIKDKYRLNPDSVKADLDDFIENEKEMLHSQLNLTAPYNAYKKQHEKELREKYKRENPLHNCTVRGFKVRGNFNSLEAAEKQAEEFRASEPLVSTFIGEVGMWQVFDPAGATKTQFMEPELNRLYSERMLNQKRSEEAFQERVRNEKLAAYEANRALCEKTGIQPTQVLDENGNLVNTKIDQTVLEQREEANELGTLSENLARRDKITESGSGAMFADV